MTDFTSRMEDANPGWFVIYEPKNREIIALPRFGAPPMTMVRSNDPGEVVRGMRRIEDLARMTLGLTPDDINARKAKRDG